MAYYHSGSQGNTRHSTAHFRNQLSGLGRVHVAVHPRKHVVGNMLERDVHIAAHFGIGRHNVYDVLREISRVGVVNPYAFNPVHG